jgi:hypothetical protein
VSRQLLWSLASQLSNQIESLTNTRKPVEVAAGIRLQFAAANVQVEYQRKMKEFIIYYYEQCGGFVDGDDHINVLSHHCSYDDFYFFQEEITAIW